MGVLVIGNRALPVYVLASAGTLLTVALLIVGGFVAAATDGQSWGLLAAAGIPAALTFIGLVVGGIASLVHGWIKNSKFATEVVRGTRSNSRY